MSQATRPQGGADGDEILDRLYELSEEFETIAASDADYATYAEEGLRKLREAGYDV